MNFGEAADNISTRIKRPDKVDECGDAINRAIGIFATSTWYHDLVEPADIALVADEYVQAIDITASPFVRFRKIKYLRPTGYRKFLTWQDPSRIWQEGCEALNTWYRAGNYIRFKLSSLQSYIAVGYYAYHAPLVEDDDIDWMLDEMWPAVQAYALAEMFRDIGNDGEAANYDRKWPMLLAAYKDDLGDGVSHG